MDNPNLTKKVAGMSPEARYDRLLELAKNTQSDDDLLEFTKLFFGPEAILADE
jgi:hypothetical protein